MKKHIFGFALFRLIFASFAFVFFNSSKIKSLNVETKDPESIKNQKLLVYKLQSVQFDLDSGKLISQIELTWNGFEPPSEIFVHYQVTGFRDENFNFFVCDRLDKPFKNGKTVTVAIATTTPRYSGDEKDNLYAAIRLSDDAFRISKENYSELAPVLFVHGNDSKIKK